MISRRSLNVLRAKCLNSIHLASKAVSPGTIFSRTQSAGKISEDSRTYSLSIDSPKIASRDADKYFQVPRGFNDKKTDRNFFVDPRVVSVTFLTASKSILSICKIALSYFISLFIMYLDISRIL